MPKLFRIAAYTYLGYLFLALAIISPALTLLPPRLAGDYVDRPLSLDWAWFNPFTLSLEVRGLELTEKNGEPFTGLSEASVNLSLASLFSKGIVLDALRLKDFHVAVQQLDAGVFNFSDLIPPSEEPAAEPEESGEILALTIGEVDLHASHLAFSDLTRDDPLTSEWRDLLIQAQDLSTVQEDGKPYNIALTGPSGGRLSWQGDVSLPLSESHGRLEIEGLVLHQLWRLGEPWLNFRLDEGTLNVGASYSISWADDFTYNLTEGGLSLAGIEIEPKDPDALPDTSVGLSAFNIADISVNGPSQQVTIGQISGSGLAVEGFNDEEIVSLQTLFTPNLPGSEEAPAEETATGETPAEDASTEESVEWRAEIGGIALNDSSVRWGSPFTDPAVTEVTPINLKVGAVSWPADGATSIALDLAINERATLAVNGDIDIGAGDGAINYDLKELQLPWFNPALPANVTARLGTGALAVNGSVTLAEFAPGTVALSTAVTNFALVQHEGESEFGSFEAIKLDKLAVDIPAQQVALDRFLLDTFKGRLHIDKDGTVSTSHLMAPAEEDEVAEVEPAEEAEAEAPATEEDTAEAEPWQVAIKEIVVRDTSVDFSDESLSSEFRTDIQSLNGSIVGLDSTSSEPARVNLEGSVDGYAPVLLSGTANPLATPPMLDLELEFDGLDMARFTPYSGTYAGYKIDRGLLNIKLDYDLADNKINGSNEIVINKLKLGATVDSDRALDLPLKAALALLTDANGVIDLAVPVSGNLDDPQFSIGAVVGAAFTKVIMKAVTAPFSLLAGLVGSDDDFQHIVFTSGSAELDERNREKLTGLAGALAQRPGLNLALAGQLHPEGDPKALKQAALNAELEERGLAPADIEDRTPAWEAVISKRYKRLDDAQEGLTAVEQHRVLRAAVPLPEEQLAALAADRAAAVQAFLTTTAQLPIERVKIDPSRLDDDVPPISGVQLFLDD